MEKKIEPTLHELYPYLTEKELAEVEGTFERYLTLVLRIFERLESEPNPQAGQLTRNNGTLPCTALGSKSSK